MKLNADNQRYVFDAENRIKEFFNSANSTTTNPNATYEYDGEGKRVKKFSDGVTTIFVYNAGGTLVAEYSTELNPEPQVSYLTSDHLGSPRIVTDGGGAVISRHDYMAFGDEVTTKLGNVGGRMSAQGYGEPDDVRKQYTGYERDKESGLDYAQARYYNSNHGRFTSVDPLVASANVKDPQTFNRYTYAMNSPYKFTDPLGLISSSTGACGQFCANHESQAGIEAGDSGYQDVSKNFAEEEDWTTYEYTRTTVIATTMTSGNQAANVTVIITDKWYVTLDSNGGEVIGPGVPPKPTTSTRVQVDDVSGKASFSETQKSTIKSVTQDLMDVAQEKGVSARVVLALGIKESLLGIGGVAKENIDPKTKKPYPHKLPIVNPLQLSGGRGKAGIENRKYNIRGALDEFISQSKSNPDFKSAISGFGGEGVRPSQKNYSADVLKAYDQISTSVSPTRWRCYSGCR